MTNRDLVILYDTKHKAIAMEYAGDGDLFKQEFRNAWYKLMNMDRFDGPTNNVCDNGNQKHHTEELVFMGDE